MPVATREVPDRLEHQPALDGLRGLAVIAVLVFHQNLSHGWGRGGFLGVDLFFVLSGFLITTLLLIDHARTGRVVSINFWARRARRLLPALLVLLLLGAAYAAFVAKPYELNGIRSTALATVLYVNNFWQTTSAHRDGPLILNHTWSLSIEEQFYLVWPILLALIVWMTRRRTHWMLVAFGVLTATSVALMANTYKTTNMWPAYFGTASRAQSLLVGAALAVALLGWRGPAGRRGRVALEAAGILALALLLVMLTVVGSSSPWLFHGGFLLVAIASATLIAAAGQSQSPIVGRVLSVRPLMAAGVISYGLYLFHPPIYAWLDADRVGFNGLPLFALRICVTLAVAVASYYFIERPIRRGAVSWHRLRVLAPVATFTVIAVVVAATLGSGPVPTSALTGYFYSQLAASAPRGATRVLVAGDAVAYSLGQPLGGSFTGDGIVGTTASVADCGIGSGSVIVGTTVQPRADCSEWPGVYKNAIDSFTPDVSVLMVGPEVLRDRVVDGRRLRVGTPEYARYLRGQLDLVRAALGAHGTPLVLLTTPCWYPPGAGASKIAQNRSVASVNAVFEQFAAQHPTSVVIGDYANLMCPRGVPLADVDGQPVRRANGALLTKAGALATWKWLAQTSVIRERVQSKEHKR